MLNRSMQWHARQELRSLRIFILRQPWTEEPHTPERVRALLRAMIEVSDVERRQIDGYCALHPEDTDELYAALELRERMLKLL